MINRIRNFLAPPVFQDEEKTRIARLLNIILYSLILLLIAVNLFATIISLLSSQALPDPYVSVVAIAIFAGLIVFMRLGFVRQVSFALSFVLSGVITLAVSRATSLISATTMGYFVAIIVAGLFAGGWSALIISFFNLLSIGILNYLAVQGVLQLQPLTQTDFITLGAVFSMSALLLGLTSRSIREALARARQNELAQIEANREILALQATLENRVTDRTKALATSAEVSRRLSTILDQDQLLKEVVEQVQKSFNYYHAHIYLFSSDREDLLMVGGTGEAGRTMLGHKHRIPAGRGLVGRAGETNEVVLVPDTILDPNWLPNPLLPETKAEVAVPIALGDEVLGVLDVQHNITNGLKTEDAELLQSIANQVAVALQNAQSYSKTRQQAEQETIVNALAREIQQATRVEEVLQIVVTGLGNSLGVKRAVAQVQNATIAPETNLENRIWNR